MPVLTWQSMAAKTMNFYSLRRNMSKYLPELPESPLLKSVRSGTAEITPQQYIFWATMAKSVRCLGADGSISQGAADCLPAHYPGIEDAVTFNNIARRMVYELSNRSNSSPAAHVSSRIFIRRSRTVWLRPF